MSRRPPLALTIAGSDPSGGAGILADLRTFTALGVRGVAVITAVTAQNRRAVLAALAMPATLVRQQIDAVLEESRPSAVKTGMLAEREIVDAVARAIAHWELREALVVDPVIVATSGGRLLAQDAVAALVSKLLPLARLVTPNLPEAAALVGHRVAGSDEIRQAGRELLGLGTRAVLIKGGHAPGDPTDWLFDGEREIRFTRARVPLSRTHGTGCVLSAAIAAGLALGLTLEEAVRDATAHLSEVLMAEHDASQDGEASPVAS